MDYICKNLSIYSHFLSDIIVIENIFLYMQHNLIKDILDELEKQDLKYNVILYDLNIINYNEIVFN